MNCTVRLSEKVFKVCKIGFLWVRECYAETLETETGTRDVSHIMNDSINMCVINFGRPRLVELSRWKGCLALPGLIHKNINICTGVKHRR